jgi:uroporphyrinogen decarboxylase
MSRSAEMTPKQRVLTAFAHAEPDRVPIDYFANPGVDARLKEHHGLAPEDDEGLRRALGVDFRGFVTPYVGPRLHAEVAGRWVDPQWGTRKRWIEHEAGGYMDYCDFPLRDADEETVANWPMPSPDDYDYSGVEAWCQANEPYALYVGSAGVADIINRSGMIRHMEQVLVDLVLDEPAWRVWADRRMAVELEVLRRTLEAARGWFDFFWMGEDLGTQRGPLISLETYRRVLRPRHQQYVDLAKAYELPVMIHSCGSSSWAFEDFIEMGIDGVDTLQPEARDMAPGYLKERFGGRLFFHGCISTAGPVTFGTPEDVVSECRAILEVMKPGGGYCFSPTHRLQDNSPSENVLAMYETAQRYGRY